MVIICVLLCYCFHIFLARSIHNGPTESKDIDKNIDMYVGMEPSNMKHTVCGDEG